MAKLPFHHLRLLLLPAALLGFSIHPLYTTKLNRRASNPPSRALSAHFLTSALESLANERCLTHPEYTKLKWMEPTSPLEVLDDDVLVPLYPLSAVHLPNSTHRLVNIEARNLQMARDLDVGGRFCIVLAAVDSGRIASIGTMLRIVELDDQGSRIVIDCAAEELVEIVGVDNPSASQREHRMRYPNEYLRAWVRKHPSDNNTAVVDAPCLSDLTTDYHRVRDLYSRDGSVTSGLLPVYSRQGIDQSLPLVQPNAFVDDFWSMASAWQTLANTVREGSQLRLSADRNEALVAGAMKKGGPLKLPVDIEDLAPKDRRQISQLEQAAQQAWLAMELEPCLDFQVLLTLETPEERIKWLAKLIQRERERIEELEQYGAVIAAETELPPETPRKGAWFEEG